MKIISKLLQKHLEGFEAAYNELGDVRGASTNSGAIVRAALGAGWFGENGEVDVGEMNPRDVRQLAEDINRAYSEVTTLDPN